MPISNPDDCLPRLPRSSNADRPLRRGVFDCVRDDVLDHLLELDGVGMDPKGRGRDIAGELAMHRQELLTAAIGLVALCASPIAKGGERRLQRVASGGQRDTAVGPLVLR